MSRTTHAGRCLCERSHYVVEGEPVRSNVCHCRFCQRLTGSAFLVEPVFEPSQITFLGDALATYDHIGKHGRRLTLHSCRTCGTRLGLTFERFPQVFAICGGTFDSPTWFEIGRHIFTGTAVPWFRFPGGVDCFEKHAITEDGAPEIPWQSASSAKSKRLA